VQEVEEIEGNSVERLPAAETQRGGRNPKGRFGSGRALFRRRRAAVQGELQGGGAQGGGSRGWLRHARDSLASLL
jgi:hypothetical protein